MQGEKKTVLPSMNGLRFNKNNNLSNDHINKNRLAYHRVNKRY
jgi:hypothetical protein